MEAQQFESDGIRIVAPIVFGYTEQARRIKKITVPSSNRTKWTEEMFFDHFSENVGVDEANGMRGWHRDIIELGYEGRMGTGAQRGSINYVYPDCFKRSVVSVYSDGELALNLYWLNDTPEEERRLAKLIELLQSHTKIYVPSDARYNKYDFQTWWQDRDGIIESLREAKGL